VAIDADFPATLDSAAPATIVAEAPSESAAEEFSAPAVEAAAEVPPAADEDHTTDALDEQPAASKQDATGETTRRELSKPGHDEAGAASDDDESLAAFMNLPAQRRSTAPMPRTFDEAILSIRPLALRQELEALRAAPASPWRRSVPYAMLALVLIAVIANLALLVLFRRDAGRDAAALQESLKKQSQLSAELILQEVREELRAPVAQNAQAIQAMGDSVLAKQEALAEKLAAQLAATAKQPAAAAPEDEQAKRATEESRAAMMRELSEIKTALADMRKAAAPPPAPAVAPTAPAQAETAPADAADAITAGAQSRAGDPSAAPGAAAALMAPRKGFAQSFVIDASGALQNSIPEAVAEVRRAIDAARSGGNVRILLVYQGRLIELPPAALQAPGSADPIDRGEGDVAAAVKLALKDRPGAINLLSDTLGGVEAVQAVLRKADMAGTSVNVTQFYARDNRDQLKSLAREYHGTYGYVAPR
jgi:hypothetical protein